MPASGAATAATESSRRATVGGAPASDRLHRHRHRQQQPERAGEAGAQAEEGRRPPARLPAPRPAHRQEAADEQDEQGRLGVAHDQHEGRGRQAEQPDRPVGQRPVTGLPAHQDQKKRRWPAGPQTLATTTRAVPSETPGRTARARAEQREEGEEAQRLVAEGAVAQPGDRLVPPGVPAEQPLVDPGRGAGRGVGAVDQRGGPGRGRRQHDQPGPPPTGGGRPPPPARPAPSARSPRARAPARAGRRPGAHRAHGLVAAADAAGGVNSVELHRLVVRVSGLAATHWWAP